ncbi:MAG TPA: YdcF family protein [Candidatus Merdibacter merdavium]|uniref:YdcF family protein n=1 Tax=Candidatus Merdibacter merdavium TaxID=2838692 RepID=A0A9D2SWG0_9FIRM|nr:YdcF family protein [Candidatus Merdibacter merdavium]
MLKKMSKALCALFVSLSVMLSGLPAIHASQSSQELIGELIRYYAAYQESAETDIMRVLDELEDVDAAEAEVWGQIMDYWSYVNTKMDVNLDVAPDGLPDDDTLCFVVLGYQLNPDGSMRDELIGRLSVALASAEKYPNAYVACTGGGTAADNPNATEADQMAAWLIEQGLDPDRIIVENKSSSTVENAEFTYRILREEYPEIDSLALITSDYHIPRGCLLYNARLLLSAYEAGDKLLTIDSNAGYRAGHEGYESVALQANGVCQIAGLYDLASQISDGTYEQPTLSRLISLNITITPQKTVQVKALYTSGYTRDVTDLAEISGYDPNAEGDQEVTAVYSENGVRKAATIKVSNAQIDDPAVEDPGQEEEQKPSQSGGAPTSVSDLGTVYAAMIMTAAYGMFMLRRKSQR